ncbi:MAG: TlpA family protein disulfide reductase [Candidatus Omnitrophica bacterium]|nr:TlpA family protein disulfide reductase [Candidatus Omnitrophota bacterium]
MNTKKSLFISLIIMCSFVISSCAQKIDGKITASDLGIAPDFTVEKLDGGKFSLSGELKEKNAVLVFWTTWCPYCVKEIPAVEKLYKEKGGDLAIIGISLQESKTKVAGFVAKKAMTYPIGLDMDGMVADKYGIQTIPSIVAIDKKGKILYQGSSLDDMLEKTGF